MGRDSIRDALALGVWHWAAGAGGGIGLAVVTWLTYPLAVAWAPDLETQVAALYEQLEDAPGPVAAAPILGLVVAVEELVWRGLVYDVLIRRVAPATALALGTVAYALPHTVSGSWVLFALALGCGAVWTLQRHFTGGLLAPLLTHLVWDILVFVAHPVTG